MKKKCSKCDKIKDVSEFNKSKNCKGGLDGNCKECRKQYYENNKEARAKYDKRYGENNKEAKAKYDKQYRKRNKDKSTMCSKLWAQNNKEKVAKMCKQYSTNNKVAIAKRNKQCRDNNKEDYSKRNKQYRMSNAKYKLFFNKLTIDESPRLHNDGISLEVKCRYCGKYFVPTHTSVNVRVKTLNGSFIGDNYLYCSDNCKTACPVYRMRKYPKGFKHTSSREVNSLVRKMVLERDNWTCQICGKTVNEAQLHCHHMDPATQNPMFQNDVDSCITLCKGCHKMVHKQYGCRYIDLRCKTKKE